MNPQANVASDSSQAVTCAEVHAGDEFAADVYVTNIDSLTAWELRVDFDPAVVSLESADYDYMLVKSGGSVFPSEFEQEKPGRMFLAAAEAHSPDGGSGILAELHLKALASGSSPLRIATNPRYFGPQLTGARGLTVGDTNGDRIWDGAVTGATVKVGQPCPSVTPAPATPSPAPGGSTPKTSPANGGQTTPGHSGDGTDTSTGSGPLVIEPGADGSNDNGDGSSPAANDSNANSNQQPGDSGNPAPNVASAGGGSGSSTLVIIIAGLIGGIAIVAGSTLLLLRRTSAD